MKRLCFAFIMFFAAVFTGCEFGMTDYYNDLAEPGTFTVTYDPNGAEGGIVPRDDVEYREGARVTVKGNEGILTKEHFNFCGWYRQWPDGKIEPYSSNMEFTIGKDDVTLYANWTDKQVYGIVYNANGGSGVAPEDKTGYTDGQVVTMPGPGDLTRDNYDFKGWNTAADCLGSNYIPGSSFNMDAEKTTGGKLTLWANWVSREKHRVYYMKNNPDKDDPATGSVPEDSTTYEYGAKVKVSANAGTLYHDHYSVSSWNTNDSGTGTTYNFNSELSMPDNDVFLYAFWIGKSYTVTYNANGSTGGSVPTMSTHAYNSTVTAAANNGNLIKIPAAGTAEAFKFGGWNTKADGTGITYAAGSGQFLMGGENLILYARWIPYEVGDTGPGGGTIFYLKSSFSDNWKYLEASPDIITGYSWSPSATAISGADGIAIGTGWMNTLNIVSQYGAGSNYAARYCRLYSRNGYTDWFLPSRLELNEMINTIWQSLRTGCCNIVWTSTQSSAQDAVIFYEVDENPVFGNESKTSTPKTKFRPIRRF